jgi:formate hydrogenlyase subunit 3/multisubunit Na+/H+ antiporter MnhD subunit
MSAAFLLAAICLPLLIAPLLLNRGRGGRVALAIAPWMGLPALLLAALPVEYRSSQILWLLLETQVGLDPLGRLFLLFSALLWTVSGVYARAYIEPQRQRGFMLFFLLTMVGNLALPIAADVATFYLFFALMTFAGYGLVVHQRGEAAERAGRVYIGLAVVGEAFLLAGLLLAVHSAGSLALAGIPAAVAVSPHVGPITGALLVGFGIKAGAVPLHVWLPLAHPVAPTPASAVLSGSMIKAGLLGWLRFLPLGETAMPGWGTAVIGFGVLATFFGVMVGMVQTDPKTVLAYSSISQMGVINVGMGIALASPASVVPAVGAVAMYAAHHGLAKGALFLGVGVAGAVDQRGAGRGFVALGLLLPALAIAGAPLTSGGVAKGELKTLLPFSPGPWPLWLEWLLPLSAFATTLLMARFLVLVAAGAEDTQGHPVHRGLIGPWAVLLAGVAFTLWLLPRFYPLEAAAVPGLPEPGYIGIDVLPLAAGGLVFWFLLRGRRWFRSRGEEPVVAAGDLIVYFERIGGLLPGTISAAGAAGGEPGEAFADRWYQVYARSDRQDILLRLELALTRWSSAILLTLLVSACLVLLLARWA